LAIVLSVLFRYTDSDYPFGIFKLFFQIILLFNNYKGLYRATLEDNPDRHLVEKFLKYWCRVNMVKQGKNYSVKTALRQQAKHIDLVYLLEKHENSIEFALATLSGKVQILKSWKKRVGMSISYTFTY
jgi:hypothetical protein